MYAKQLSEQIAAGFARCTRQFSNYYDWEFELEFQVRVAMNPENPGFLIGTLLLLEGVKNPVRKTLISVCYQSERDLAKTFVDLYFESKNRRLNRRPGSKRFTKFFRRPLSKPAKNSLLPGATVVRRPFAFHF